MKIVFLGNFEVDYSSENHHAKSLEKLGHEVIKLQENQATSEEILNQALDSKLFIWVHTHGWQTPGTVNMTTVLNILKKVKIPAITYHLDLWLGLEREKDLHNDSFYKDIAYFFATDKLMADWFNNNTEVKGCYMPAGVYSEECYIDKSGDEAANDIIFVGSKNYHPEWDYRSKLIDNLKHTFGAQFTHIGGDGDTGTIRGERLNRVYASSKVAVGDTLCIGFDYPYYFSDRLFESTGRGGFTIFPYIKGIEDMFEIDKEIVTYNYGDFKELEDKIRYYLQNGEEREKIRSAGHNRAKKDHTYVNRWSEILRIIDEDNNK
jgi:hypothetical protein